MRRDRLWHRALMLNEADRLDGDAGGVRRAGREDGRLAERAGGFVVNGSRQRLPRRTDGGGRSGPSRREVLRAFGPAQDQRQGDEEQPEQSAGSHWLKGERAV